MCSSQKLQICQSLWACLSMCLHGNIPKCLFVFVCKVSRSSSVCVSRLPLLQKAHFLPTTPAFFYCSSASLQSFPFLLISMMFLFISSTFSFIPHITHAWLYSFHSITPHICKLLRKGDSCFIVFHIYIEKGTNIDVWLTFDYCSLDRSHHATQFLG